MKIFDSIVSIFESNPLWRYHIPIPEKIATSLIEENDRRMKVTLNNRITWQCALMPSPSGWYIILNKKNRSKLGIKEGITVKVQLEKDKTTYGFDMPIELTELLNQDDEGNKYFHDLTPGKQRSLIYLVLKVKNSNSRLNKSLAIVHHLKEMQGKLNFKLLNQTIKEFNKC